MNATWQTPDGSVQLYLGDALDVLPEIEAVDAIVTDPPFGISFAAQPTKWQRRAGQRPEAWDDVPADPSSLVDIAPLVAIWGGNYFTLPPSRGWLVWYKPDAPPSMASAELCWTNRDTNTRQISHSISATNAERVGHPTQKPIRVMAWTMQELQVPAGAVVLDPFMGSATTGVSCLRTGRQFIGIENNPAYFAIAVKRIEAELNRYPLLEPQPEQGTLQFAG